jgi:hypothetical protein
MRKTKPTVTRRVSVIGRRLVIRPLDDGIMTVPIATEQRASADAEMKDFINRLKKNDQLSSK